MECFGSVFLFIRIRHEKMLTRMRNNTHTNVYLFLYTRKTMIGAGCNRFTRRLNDRPAVYAKAGVRVA